MEELNRKLKVQTRAKSRARVIVRLLVFVEGVFALISGSFGIIFSNRVPYGEVFGFLLLFIGVTLMISVIWMGKMERRGWNIAIIATVAFIGLKLIQMIGFGAKPYLGLNIGISVLIFLLLTSRKILD